MSSVLTTILTWLIGGGLVSLVADGLKTAFLHIDRASRAGKLALLAALSLVCVLLIRGFSLPATGAGWAWFLLIVLLVFLIAQGWFRIQKRVAGTPTVP